MIGRGRPKHRRLQVNLSTPHVGPPNTATASGCVRVCKVGNVHEAARSYRRERVCTAGVRTIERSAVLPRSCLFFCDTAGCWGIAKRLYGLAAVVYVIMESTPSDVDGRTAASSAVGGSTRIALQHSCNSLWFHADSHSQII